MFDVPNIYTATIPSGGWVGIEDFLAFSGGSSNTVQQDSSDLAPYMKIPSRQEFVWQNSLRLLSGKQEVVSSNPA